MALLYVLALGSMLFAQGPSPSLPVWLTPYAGAEWKVSKTSGTLNASYTVDAKEDQVLSHLQAAFSAAGVPFHPQSNGVGTSIQARTEECSLLISVREVAGKTQVRMTCAVPIPSAPAAAPSRPETVVSMPGNSASGGTASALAWPAWLVPVGSGSPLRPTQRVTHAEACLEARYRTNSSLSDIHDFYSRAAEANGYRMVGSQVTTRQSVTGNLVFGEPNGIVEACRPESGSSTGPRHCVKAVFSGDPHKGPTSVQLVVRHTGGLARR